jgi:DeoR/GlpR family transcriptional regulator of sugar metabolism
LNIDRKKAILAFLGQNPGASVLKIHASVGIPEWTLRKLVNELVEDKMVVRVKYGWKLSSGADILSGKLQRKDQVTEKCIRNMIRVPK